MKDFEVQPKWLNIDIFYVLIPDHNLLYSLQRTD